MRIESPAVFLSFDDCYVKEWHSFIPLFEKFGVRTTFYLSYFADMNDSDWKLIRELKSFGHSIAYHGFNHIRAGEMVHGVGCIPYLKREIYPGLKVLLDNGLDGVRHFAYPRGNRSPKSDQCLLTLFKTLRIGGRQIHTPESIKKTRILRAFNFGKFPERRYCGHEALLKLVVKNKKIICFYMHEPVEHRLHYMFNLGESNGVNFYPMEVLNQ